MKRRAAQSLNFVQAPRNLFKDTVVEVHTFSKERPQKGQRKLVLLTSRVSKAVRSKNLSLKMLKSCSNDTRRKSYKLCKVKCENIIRQTEKHLKNT